MVRPRKTEPRAALESYFAGLQVSAGLSVVGAIVGEFVGGGGLGGLIDSARTQQKLEMVFGAVILSGIIGLFWIFLITFTKRHLRHFVEQ